MFGQKSQRIAELEALAARRAERITELEGDARGLRYSSRHHAELADRLGQRALMTTGAHARTVLALGRVSVRLHRVIRAVARERAENTGLRARLVTLQAAYDNAVGLDRPALDAGADWQSRRADKRAEYATTGVVRQ
ncbi:hypothetical protein [Streptomyces sp. NPDC060198]|uniref:hypothetical protein n=1 Tax=Streptomyces sp. NPDC060198 TaxID=3347070 RepID=UPI00364F524A